MTDISTTIEQRSTDEAATGAGRRPLLALLVGPRRDGRLHEPRSIALLEETARLADPAVRIGSPVDRPA